MSEQREVCEKCGKPLLPLVGSVSTLEGGEWTYQHVGDGCVEEIDYAEAFAECYALANNARDAVLGLMEETSAENGSTLGEDAEACLMRAVANLEDAVAWRTYKPFRSTQPNNISSKEGS